MNKKLIVASRKSNLALRQVEEVFDLLTDVEYELISLQSYGDNHKDISLLNDNIPADFFTKELDFLLLDEKADVAIHSAKDLPYPLPQGLEIIALTHRVDNSDSLVCRKGLPFNKLNQLPDGTIVGTSSAKRKSELNLANPHLVLKGIRGTIEERLEQADKGDYDAVIVATCALKRLGLEDRISEILPFETHPLQGSLAVVAKKGRTDLAELFRKIDFRPSLGKVYLVGAGPGDPELMTVKGRKLLAIADIIYYDDLIDKSVFEDLENMDTVYVGKRKGVHSKEQKDINTLLVNSAFDGKTIVRLKGGDPMIFAHGGEEVEYLQSNLIEVEVIPGISTANALASVCKIPLTHRDIASSLAFVSGHALHGQQIPETDTLVLYMAGSRIREITKAMLAQGRDADTPVALVHNVSRPDQKEFFYTLKELSDEEIQFPTPIIVIVGKVVDLRFKTAKEINSRKNILVTGLDIAPYAHLGKIVHTPLIEIQPLENKDQLRTKISRLKEFQNLLFTSRNTVHYFFEEMLQTGIDCRHLREMKIFSIGKTTSQELLKHGIIADFQAENEDSAGVVEMFRKHQISGHVLVPRSDLALEIIPKGLKDIGLSVETVIAYRNTMPEAVRKVDLNSVDVIVFSSPSCVENFLKVYGKIPLDKRILVRGVTTYSYLQSIDYPVNNIDIYKVQKLGSD